MSDAPPTRLTRAESRAQTRRRLLEAAADVVARRGFAGATVEEIAATAGYTTGALYANFANKDDLLVALLAHRRSHGTQRRVAAMDALADQIGRGDVDPDATLTRLFADAADRDRDASVLQDEFWLYAMRHPDAMAVIAEHQRPTREAVDRLVRALGGTDGPFMSRAEVTTVVLALFQGLARQRRINPSAVPTDLFVRAVRQIIGD